MLSLLVWLMFGVIAVVQASQSLTWQAVAHAVLSLKVILMLAGRGGAVRWRSRSQAQGLAGPPCCLRSPAVSPPGIPRRG